jgi:hypothetical protein
MSMRKRVRYTKTADGETFAVPVRQWYRMGCCDCGLIHDVWFVPGRQKIYMKVYRNNRATAARRAAERKMGMNESLAQFAADIIRRHAWGNDVDGGDVQEKAVQYGILRQVEFDPTIHEDAEGYGLEKGDPWFEFTPEFDRALKGAGGIEKSPLSIKAP